MERLLQSSVFKQFQTPIFVHADPHSEGMSCILCVRNAKAPVDELGVIDGLHVGTARCAEVLVDGSTGRWVDGSTGLSLGGGSQTAARFVLVFVDDDHEDSFHYQNHD